MKIRNGFVSNSSSSSFLVAVKVGGPCEHCGRRDFNFFDFFRGLGDYDCDSTRLTARGLEETLAKLQEDLDDYKCDYDVPLDSYEAQECANIEAKMEECKKLTEDGYEVGFVRISYHDSAMQGVMRQFQETGAVTVLIDRC